MQSTLWYMVALLLTMAVKFVWFHGGIHWHQMHTYEVDTKTSVIRCQRILTIIYIIFNLALVML